MSSTSTVLTKMGWAVVLGATLIFGAMMVQDLAEHFGRYVAVTGLWLFGGVVIYLGLRLRDRSQSEPSDGVPEER